MCDPTNKQTMSPTTTTAITNPTCCEECNGSFGCLIGVFPRIAATPCYKCQKLLCSTCANKYGLIEFDKSKPADVANDLSKNNVIESYCKQCFQETSVLDFTKTYDDMKPPNGITLPNDYDDDGGNTTSGKPPLPSITFVIVHGGGSSRALYKPYAYRLIEMGYRCILLDLPGHGSLADDTSTILSLDTCVSTIQNVLRECHINPENNNTKEKVIYMGCSLGAYVGFYVLGKLHDYFSGAIQIDCGQNVGPTASLKAKCGLWFLKHMTQAMSNKGLMSAMLGVTEKSKSADWKLVESTFGVGMFFQQGLQQVECLKSVNPTDWIPLYTFPVLFMNGGLDHRDCENKWLELCQDQEHSKLKVYEHGDHFFTHDSRYVEDIIQQIDTFAMNIRKL